MPSEVPALIDEVQSDQEENDRVTSLAAEIAEWVMTAIPAGNQLKRMIAAEVLVHALVILSAIPDEKETHEEYEGFTQHVLRMTTEELVHAKVYGHLVIDYELNQIVWDDVAECWKGTGEPKVPHTPN